MKTNISLSREPGVRSREPQTSKIDCRFYWAAFLFRHYPCVRLSKHGSDEGIAQLRHILLLNLVYEHRGSAVAAKGSWLIASYNPLLSFLLVKMYQKKLPNTGIIKTTNTQNIFLSLLISAWRITSIKLMIEKMAHNAMPVHNIVFPTAWLVRLNTTPRKNIIRPTMPISNTGFRNSFIGCGKHKKDA